MACGSTPFIARTDKEVYDNILSRQFKFPDTLEDESLKSLIDDLLQLEPQKRLGMQGHDTLKGHPFFASVDFEAIKRMEVPVPAHKVLFDPQNPGRALEFDLSTCVDSCPCRQAKKRKLHTVVIDQARARPQAVTIHGHATFQDQHLTPAQIQNGALARHMPSQNQIATFKNLNQEEEDGPQEVEMNMGSQEEGNASGSQQNMTVTSVGAVQNIYEELKYNKFKSQIDFKQTSQSTINLNADHDR